MALICVIDDEPKLRQLIVKALSSIGHVVREAGDGNGALREIAQRHPDLVITDIIMPNMEGIETILELRRMHPDLKIIAMSGSGPYAPKFLEMARKFGALSTIDKPFRIETLLNAVRSALGDNPISAPVAASAAHP